MVPTHGMWYARSSAHAFIPGTEPEESGFNGPDTAAICGYEHCRWSLPETPRPGAHPTRGDEKCRSCEDLSKLSYEDFLVKRVIDS